MFKSKSEELSVTMYVCWLWYRNRFYSVFFLMTEWMSGFDPDAILFASKKSHTELPFLWMSPKSFWSVQLWATKFCHYSTGRKLQNAWRSIYFLQGRHKTLDSWVCESCPIVCVGCSFPFLSLKFWECLLQMNFSLRCAGRDSWHLNPRKSGF